MGENVTSSVSNANFPVWSCLFITTEGNPTSLTKTYTKNVTFTCRAKAYFLVSDKYGPSVCLILCCCVYLVGLFGLLANILNVSVLRKPQVFVSNSFRFLLMILACFEFVACLSAMASVTALYVILGNVSRTHFTFLALKVVTCGFSLARIGANYMTILITIERLIVICFPLRAKSWLSSFKTKIYVTVIFLLIFIGSIRWICYSSVEKNTSLGISSNPNLEGFPYVYIISNPVFGERLVKALLIYDFIDYFAPFPVLMILNGILYIRIHIYNRSRKALSCTQEREVNAAKMFSIITYTLLLCHSVGVVIALIFHLYHLVYREIFFLSCLAVTISSSVNILVYMGLGGKQFKEEIRRQVYSRRDIISMTSVNNNRGSPVKC